MKLGDLLEFDSLYFVVVEMSKSMDGAGKQLFKYTIEPLDQYRDRVSTNRQDTESKKER